MLYYKHSRLNGLGCPLGIETRKIAMIDRMARWLNGLGCPLGIETPCLHRHLDRAGTG